MESPSMLAPPVNPASSSAPLEVLHRHYILLKAHYFLFFSAFGVLYPILGITLRSRGLSDSEISYMSLIIPFMVFFANPLMGYIADHTRRYLSTFNVILVVITISYCAMFLLPSIKTHHIEARLMSDENLGRVLDFCASQEVATKCSSRSECGCSYQANCRSKESNLNFTFTMNSNDTRRSIGTRELASCGLDYRVSIQKYLPKNTPDVFTKPTETSSSPACEISCSIPYFCHGRRYPKQLLPILLYSLLFIVGTNFLNNAIAVGASIGFSALPSAEIFGEQRVWGTIGFGISALLASRLYAIFNTEFVYIIMFTIVAVLCILVTSFIRIRVLKKKLSIPDDGTGKVTDQEMDDLSGKGKVKEKRKKNLKLHGVADLLPLFKQIDVLVFFSLAFIWGMSYAALDPYVYLYIDEIAPCQSRSIIGWMSMIAAISELFALFFAGRMLKFIGTSPASVIILLAFAVRFSAYYFIRRVYYILFAETMHYFNFGILYVLVAQKANSIAPPGLAGTLQGLVYGITFGLGRGVGLIISSFIYTRFEPRLLFLSAAMFNALAAALYGLYFLLHRQRTPKVIRASNNLTIPKIVIDSEPNPNEEPFLGSS